ncbi:MAG: glycogen/starch synthase, partial [Elusimicrobiota bacterium]
INIIDKKAELNYGKVEKEYKELLQENNIKNIDNDIISGIKKIDTDSKTRRILDKELKSNKYKNLKNYLKVNNEIEKINPEKVLREEEKVLDELKLNLSETDEEKSFLEIIKYLNWNEKILLNRISKDKLEKYYRGKEKFEKNLSKFNKKYPNIFKDITSCLVKIKPHIKNMNRFYSLAKKRDIEFADFCTPGSEKGINVIIVGGFHVKGITEKIKRKGISYISIAPLIKGPVKQSQERYCKLLQDDFNIAFKELLKSKLALYSLVGKDWFKNMVVVKVIGLYISRLHKQGLTDTQIFNELKKYLNIWEERFINKSIEKQKFEFGIDKIARFNNEEIFTIKLKNKDTAVGLKNGAARILNDNEVAEIQNKIHWELIKKRNKVLNKELENVPIDIGQEIKAALAGARPMCKIDLEKAEYLQNLIKRIDNNLYLIVENNDAYLYDSKMVERAVVQANKILNKNTKIDENETIESILKSMINNKDWRLELLMGFDINDVVNKRFGFAVNLSKNDENEIEKEIVDLPQEEKKKTINYKKYLELISKPKKAETKQRSVQDMASDKTWMEENVPELKEKPVVYIASEIAIPNTVFAGGLGKLAADTVYAAGNISGTNMIFTTLLYQGNKVPVKMPDGSFKMHFIRSDYSKVKGIEQIRDDSGNPVEITVDVAGVPEKAKLWRQSIKGKNSQATVIYIDCPGVNYELYPDSHWDRFRQELLLGKGSIEALKKIGIKPSVIHMNESATAFAAPQAMEDEYFDGTSYVFATHTPVEAALRSYPAQWWKHAGLKEHYRDIFTSDNQIKMTHGILNLIEKKKGVAYGVSKKHGQVTRKMFPEFSHVIRSVTNGSSISFWRAPELKNISSAEEMMDAKRVLKSKMISKINEMTGVHLDINKPIALFARRLVEYKRLWMILENESITDYMFRERSQGGLGMQLVVGGNPYCDYGLKMLARIEELKLKYPDKMVFVSGYDQGDLSLNRMLLSGGDFILHIPRPPQEASGTSFQIASIQGVPSANSMDGAPLEQIKEFNPTNGKGNGFIMEQDSEQGLKEMLKKISDIYYSSINKGNKDWETLCWNAFKSSEEIMSAKRMVKDYYKDLYLPVYEASKIRWIGNLSPQSGETVKIETGEEIDINIDVELRNLKPEQADVELWSNFEGDWKAYKMSPKEKVKDNTWRYEIKIRASSEGEYYYTARAGIKNSRLKDREIWTWANKPGEDGIIFVRKKEIEFPRWINKQAIYQINCRSFGAKEKDGNFETGKFTDITDKLPEIKKMGFGVVYLNGIYPGDSIFAVDDFFKLNADLGGEK